MPKVSGLLLIPRKEKARVRYAGLFHFSGFCQGRGVVWVWNGFRLIVLFIACRRPYAYAPQ